MVRLVLCNCSPTESSALAETLVRERLAACVNVVPGVKSFYVWQDEFHVDDEHTLLIKTTPERYEALEARLSALHSYTAPEIVAFDSTAALESYLGWVHQQTTERT